MSTVNHESHDARPTDRPRVPPGQREVPGFPVLTEGATPEIRREDWRLKVFGLVREECELGFAELENLPRVRVTADFHCVTTWSRLDLEWEGVRMRDVLEHAGILESATHVLQHCAGGYTSNLPLADALLPGVLLADTVNNALLEARHGGPMRTVVPHLYAWKSAKWITGLELLSADRPGFWESRGYHMRGDPWREERFGEPGV